jgi:hypothetical protein
MYYGIPNVGHKKKWFFFPPKNQKNIQIILHCNISLKNSLFFLKKNEKKKI